VIDLWHRTFRAAAMVLLALCAFCGALAEDRGLVPAYSFVVGVDGVVDPGWQVFSGPQKNRLLLISPAGDQAFLVALAEKSVRPADTKLLLRKSGSVDVLAGSLSATRILPLTISGSSASFTPDGRTLTLMPRPPLIGPHSVEDLIKDRPDFGEGIKTYNPDGASVAFFKSYDRPTEIEIFFGSWCPVCETLVPRLLKSLDVAGNMQLKVSLIGLAHDFAQNPELARAKGIRGLPTFIIRQEGVEIGRIVGAPKDGAPIEGAVVALLKAKQEAGAPAGAAPAGS